MARLVKKMQQIREAFQKGKLLKLKDVSNEMIEEAVRENDKMLAQVAMIAYSLQKLLTKVHIKESRSWPDAKKNINSSLSKAIASISRGDSLRFQKDLEAIAKNVLNVDERMGRYVQNLYDKARVKQASTAYASGMSLSSAAELTGTTKARLQDYIGITRIHEEQPSPVGIKQRLKKFKEKLGQTR